MFNVEYMNCTWDSSSEPQPSNLTLHYWYEKGRGNSTRESEGGGLDVRDFMGTKKVGSHCLIRPPHYFLTVVSQFKGDEAGLWYL